MEEQREKERIQAQPEEAEVMEQLRRELQNLTVGDHLVYMMHSLSALAVRRLGLSEESAGQRDLDQARLAIDAFKALVEVSARARPADEMILHRSTLSQLQVAYVGALNRAGATTAPDEESSAEARDTLSDQEAPASGDQSTGGQSADQRE